MLSEPPSHLVFAFRFENNFNDEIPEVVLLVNGDEMFRFNSRDTDDQSLTLKHSLKYTNGMLFILEGRNVAGAFIDIKELVVFDGFKIPVLYEESAVMIFASGGQIFDSGFRAFYTMNANLNDQIGEALLAAKSAFQANYVYTTSIPTPSTVVPTTAPFYSQTPTLTSTENEDHNVTTKATQPVDDNSRMTKISTHPKTRKDKSLRSVNKTHKHNSPQNE